MIFKNKIPGDGVVSVLLYGEIGDGGQADSERVVAELMELASAYGRIDVHVNSKGGDVFAGIAIRNALQSSPADIAIHVDGLAASMAAVVCLCGRPLYMNRYARLMLHRVSGGGWGTADELRRVADLAEGLEADLAGIISSRCGMSPEEARAAWFDGRDHWLTAQQAVEKGLADGITDGGSVMAAAPGPEATADDIYDFTNRLIEPLTCTDMILTEELKKKPSFAAMQTEEEMLRHINALENQAAKVPALEARVDELSAQAAEARKAGHAAFLNQAVAEGRLTAEQVPVFLDLMGSDEENTRRAVEALPKRPSARVEDYIGGAAGPAAGDLARMTWDEIDRAERLAELKAGHPALYQAKFNEKFKKQ